ncbi:MAG: hypothetical protein RJA22_2545 [Verrucomicrobiota bacterium]|jgi:hypothetical protein
MPASTRPGTARLPLAAALTAALALTLAAGGCVRLPATKPAIQVKSLQAPESERLSPTTLQSAVMRFADEYAMTVAQAAEDFADSLGTYEAREVAAGIKLGQAHAAIANAAGQNPTVNALDMVVLATVTRMVAEDYLVGKRFGEKARPLVDAARKLETNAWTLAARVLKPDQQEELRELILEWRRQNPDARYAGSVRLREFSEAITNARARTGKPSSILGLLFLDPMSGLDPTVRAIEETRYLAERAFFYGQRMAQLLSWQAEYLALQLADQPAARQVLTNTSRLTATMEVFAQTATNLPTLVSQERNAALRQVFDGLAKERTNLLATLATEEGNLRSLLAETRATLQAAGTMATSVNATIQSLDTFVRYVNPPATNAVPDTNSAPFNILDYGTAATQIAGMARDLNTALATLNQSTSAIARVTAQATATVDDTLQRSFWRALILLLVLLVGSLLTALAYRFLTARLR